VLVAAKILKTSELTLFRSQFDKHKDTSKQKALNLNAGVFIKRFYPGLREHTKKIPVTLDLRGPGGQPTAVHAQSATLLKQQKNWRLNGRLIEEPPEGEPRYGDLAVNDIAVIGFEGTTWPERVTMLLVSQSLDEPLHSAIRECLPQLSDKNSMHVLSDVDLTNLVNIQGCEGLEGFLSANTVEDALYGQPSPAMGDGRGLPITPEAVTRRSEHAGKTGQLGEEAFEHWLKETRHEADSFEWVSKNHAYAAFDFIVHRPLWEGSCGGLTHIDVKTTRGDGKARIHMSLAEVNFAAEHPGYRIGRISMMTEDTAEVSILAGISELCGRIREGLEGALPNQVRVDGFNLLPEELQLEHTAKLNWAAESD